MRIWIDTEFDGFGGDLISIACVTEDAKEFYLGATPKAKYTPWVQENVIPNLQLSEYHRVGKPALVAELYSFLRPYYSVHLIADWPEDLKHFFGLLALGDQRFYTGKVTAEIYRCPFTVQNEVPHNALSDARANRDAQISYEQAFQKNRIDIPI